MPERPNAAMTAGPAAFAPEPTVEKIPPSIVPSPTATSARTPSTRRSGTPSDGRRSRSCAWRARRLRSSGKRATRLELDDARLEVELAQQARVVLVRHVGPL